MHGYVEPYIFATAATYNLTSMSRPLMALNKDEEKRLVILHKTIFLTVKIMNIIIRR